jgi:hypothetical protein
MEPDGDACCLREPDGGGAAGAGVPDEGHASVRAECDHLGVAAVPGGPAVAVPVGWVRLDLVAGCAGGVGGGDRVGSAGAGAVDQEDAAGWRPRMTARALSMVQGSSQVRLPVTRRWKGECIAEAGIGRCQLCPSAVVPPGG